VPLQTLIETVSQAKELANNTNVDVSKLSAALANIGTISKELVDQANQYLRELPRGILRALYELSRLGMEVAKKGVQLFDEVVRSRTMLPSVNVLEEGADDRRRNRWLPKNDGEIAIDLGTSNIRMYLKGKGIVLSESSVISVYRSRGGTQLRAVGTEAKKMLGREPVAIEALRPVREGAVADFEYAETLVRYLVDRIHKRSVFNKPEILISVPSGSTLVERRAIQEAIVSAGARRVYLIEEPMAAAIGIGLPIDQPNGSMVAIIGGGKTEVAIIALGGIVYSRSLRVGGDSMDDAIIGYLRRVHNFAIGGATAERIKIEIGTALPPVDGDGATMTIAGWNTVAGRKQEFTVTQRHVASALAEPVG
jgi:rod shape-determining protein MreB